MGRTACHQQRAASSTDPVKFDLSLDELLCHFHRLHGEQRSNFARELRITCWHGHAQTIKLLLHEYRVRKMAFEDTLRRGQLFLSILFLPGQAERGILTVNAVFEKRFADKAGALQ